MNNDHDDLLPEEILLSLSRIQESLRSASAINTDQLKEDLKFLRNSCAKGPRIQDFIISTSECEEVILVFTKSDGEVLAEIGDDVKRFFWQFLANLCVNNDSTQTSVYTKVGELIMQGCLQGDLNELMDIKLMILYNIFKGSKTNFNEDLAFKFVAEVWSRTLAEQSNCNLVFLHLFFEHFLTVHQWTCRTYANLDTPLRIDVLRYILTYIRNDSPNGPIKPFFMDFISKEFKKKSDKILKTESSYVDSIQPQEVLVLLKCIASASGSEIYGELYKSDHSLFLNVGSLLQSLVSLAKNKDVKTIFTPMEKLAQVAPNANISREFEAEISFEFKTLLVRTLANLSYKNNKNQEYAREMGILIAILDCTTVDARNPLMKEWSIVAVRNMCDGCPENQELISQLYKVADAPNDALTELNMELGSLRIQPGA